MSKSTRWIDLTDLSQWNGHLTGIQRVVYQIAKGYQTEENIRYFFFDERSSAFYETDFELIEQKIEQANKRNEDTPRGGKTATRGLKQLTLRVYGYLPDSARDHITPERKAAVKKIYAKTRRLISRRPNLSFSRKQQFQEAEFKKDDQVIVMGKPWDFPTFMEALRRLKLNQHFKLYQVVYDLIPIFEPHLHGEPLIKQYTQHMFEVAALSDGLLAISKSTKRDMLRFCKLVKIPTPPVSVIRLGDDFTAITPREPEYVKLKKYSFIIHVCTVEVRKNHQLVYAAYKKAQEEGVKLPDLVIVGRPGWYTQDVLYALTHDPAMNNRVHILQDVDDAELAWLYENCLFSLFPSIYEGWGLPIAESLLYKKVCLPADSSSLTEIAGDLLEYYSPYDPVALLRLIIKYSDPATRQTKEQEIATKYKPTTWQQTFLQSKSFIDKTHNQTKS